MAGSKDPAFLLLNRFTTTRTCALRCVSSTESNLFFIELKNFSWVPFASVPRRTQARYPWP